VILGAAIPIGATFESSCWLEVQVDGEPLTPRRELVSVPYAFQAFNADSLGQLSSSSYSVVGHNHGDLYVNEGQANSITAGIETGKLGTSY